MPGKEVSYGNIEEWELNWLKRGGDGSEKGRQGGKYLDWQGHRIPEHLKR